MTLPTRAISEYFDALNRLRAGRPINISKGTRICNDSVALEAGRGKGSIKKSRPVFQELIQAIEAAAAEQSNLLVADKQETKIDKLRAEARQYRNDFEIATASLVSRLYEIHELQKKVRLLEDNVQVLTERLARLSNSKITSMSRK